MFYLLLLCVSAFFFLKGRRQSKGRTCVCLLYSAPGNLLLFFFNPILDCDAIILKILGKTELVIMLLF